MQVLDVYLVGLQRGHFSEVNFEQLLVVICGQWPICVVSRHPSGRSQLNLRGSHSDAFISEVYLVARECLQSERVSFGLICHELN